MENWLVAEEEEKKVIKEEIFFSFLTLLWRLFCELLNQKVFDVCFWVL